MPRYIKQCHRCDAVFKTPNKPTKQLCPVCKLKSKDIRLQNLMYNRNA